MSPTDAKPTEVKPPVPVPTPKAKVKAKATQAPAVPAPAKTAPPLSPAPLAAAKVPAVTPKARPADRAVKAVEIPATIPPTARKAKAVKPASAHAVAKSEPPSSPAPAPVIAAKVPAVTPKATKALPAKKVVKVEEPSVVVPPPPVPTKPTKAASKVVAVTTPAAAVPPPETPTKANPLAKSKVKAKKPKQLRSAKSSAAIRPVVAPPALPPSPLAKAPALELPATSLTSLPPALFSSSTPGVPLPPIPPILLEGDHPVKLPGSTPKTAVKNPVVLAVSAAAGGHQTEPPATTTLPAPAVAPAAAPEPTWRATGEPRFSAPFPLAGALWLVARDPFNLCAHWNFDSAALTAYASENQGAWHLRVWVEMPGAWLASDQLLPVGVTHRFVPVVMPATRYVAEVGFLAAAGTWQGLAVSQPVATPADAVSMDTEVTMATVVPEPVTPDVLYRLPPDAPAVPHSTFPLLSLPDLAKAAQLSALVWKALSVSGVGNSGEITELVGEHVLLPGGASLGPTAGGPELPVEATEALPSSESVPTPLPPAPRPFWFKVNAEVILYGSTERDAQVTIGGRPVKLRDDGSFSFRFSLPDGEFQLPVEAVSAAGDDQRAAEVTFARTTVFQGEVGTHPADEMLRPPTVEAVG